MWVKMTHQQRMSNDVINTSYNPISLDHIFEDVDPLSEWLQEKENPLLDGENSGGDGQDSGTGGLSPIYDLLIGIEKNMGLVPLVAIFVTYQNSVEICLLHLVVVEKEVNLELDQKEKEKAPKFILLKVLLPVRD
ncbi:hypothetical protein V6N11_048098 [Hibiscus sabdariffa]|uniref:Uncharacterized protein n=1 Tax=Hibiscus sabdariffa TaxID=183260 RepID=A0ABR2NRV7_9ROSI